MDKIVLNNVKEIKQITKYKIAKFMINDQDILFVLQGKIDDKIGYNCIVENLTNEDDPNYHYLVYEYDGSNESFVETKSTYNVNSFEIFIPKEHLLTKLNSSGCYGSILIESTEYIRFGNVVCDDMKISVQQTSTSPSSEDGKWLTTINLYLINVGNISGQSINLYFTLDLFKDQNLTKKVLSHDFYVNIYDDSTTPGGD